MGLQGATVLQQKKKMKDKQTKNAKNGNKLLYAVRQVATFCVYFQVASGVLF